MRWTIPFALAVACTPPGPPLVPLTDAPPMDAAGIDARRIVPPMVDAPFDVGVRADVPRMDGALPDDGGGNEIVVDGVLDDEAWTTSPTSSTTTPSSGTFEGCGTTDLYVLPGAAELYLGIRGEIGGGCMASILVYVDADVGGATGLALTGLGGPDTSGELDDAFSSPLNSSTSNFAPDFGWGTGSMPLPSSTGDGASGWRRFGGATYSIPTGQQSICTATECETRIPYGSLGLGSGSRNLAVFTRICDGTECAAPTLPPDLEWMFVENALSVPVIVP